jgi:hypothetical protein
MQDCPIRKQLIGEWGDALNQLSICIDRLEGWATNGAMFDQQLRVVQFARQAENARRGLNVHSAAHKCERSGGETGNVIPFSVGAKEAISKEKLSVLQRKVASLNISGLQHFYFAACVLVSRVGGHHDGRFWMGASPTSWRSDRNASRL